MSANAKRGKRTHMRFAERRRIDPERAWYVAASWGEAADERDLREVGLDVWRPIYETTIIRRGRKLDTALAFFPGYLFVGLRLVDQAPPGQERGPRAEDMQALQRGKHVLAVLGRDGPLRVPHKVMEAIADAFSGDVKSERVQAAALYRVGETMHVVNGPFASFYALVTELLQTGHIRAEVNIFGRSTPVTFEPAQLARA